MKNYPRTRFDIVNNTSIPEIETSGVSSVIPVIMATYTSDKGSEDWEYLTDLSTFCEVKGGISFVKHGQPQLTVAEALRNGAYVYGKRLVADDATLANITIVANLLKVEEVTYVYLQAVTTEAGVKTFEDACDKWNKFNFTQEMFDTFNSEEPVQVPLFTITPMGRGASGISFRIVPEYVSSNKTYTKYSIEIIENTEVIESIVFTMNPDILIEKTNQSLENKILSRSSQVKCKLYENGLSAYLAMLATTATLNETKLSISELVNYDILNMKDTKGKVTIGGVVSNATASAVDGDVNLWERYKPEEITVANLDGGNGIPLINGSNGSLGNAPITTLTVTTDASGAKTYGAYARLMMDAYAGDEASLTSTQFDPIIFDENAFKPDCIFDCNFPIEVKNAIINLVDTRGDCVFLADLGTDVYDRESIIEKAYEINQSRNVSIYHNHFNIKDPYTNKVIRVTLPLLLVPKMISHIDTGVGRPFAGIVNGLSFTEIMEGTVNYFPVVLPFDDGDEKQKLVDNNINFLTMYDGVPVLDTMYVNDDEYTQMSFLHNIMAVQEIIKVIRSRCPYTRYIFLDGDDLSQYIEDVQNIINEYKANFRSIEVIYVADEKYEANNIFYAMLKVSFRNFITEEYFKIIAIGNEEE